MSCKNFIGVLLLYILLCYNIKPFMHNDITDIIKKHDVCLNLLKSTSYIPANHGTE